MTDYSTLNKALLLIVDSYIDKMREVGDPLPRQLERLKLGLVTFKKHNRFSRKEAEKIKALSNSERLTAIIKEPVSYTVFTLELMRLWTLDVPKDDRPYLGVSDNTFKLGGNVFFMEMLAAKKDNPEQYEEKKEIIAQSKRTARDFYDFHKKELVYDRAV